MQIKSLEIFLKIVQLKSFSDTAKQLHTVQSNVTSHIKKLEDELGVEILYRQPPIRPTRAGLQLYQYAEKIIHLQEEILASFEKTKTTITPLIIGSMETTAAVRLPAVLKNLQLKTTNFPISLKTGASRELIDQVRLAELDCAFIANHKPIDGLFNLHVWTEQLVLISSLQYTNQLSKQDIMMHKFIAFKQGCSYRKVIDIFLDHHQLPATHILEMGSLDAIVSCVSLNLGFAILPLSYVQQSHYINQIHIHEIDSKIRNIPTYLITTAQNTWSTNMWYFFDNLQTLLQKSD